MNVATMSTCRAFPEIEENFFYQHKSTSLDIQSTNQSHDLSFLCIESAGMTWKRVQMCLFSTGEKREWVQAVLELSHTPSKGHFLEKPLQIASVRN
jgi:hypothetical protein